MIYNISQNAGKSNNTGIELVLAQDVSEQVSVNINLNGFYNQLDAFTVTNLYPSENLFTAARQEVFSGNAKVNMIFKLPKSLDVQLTAIYLAPDILPQGTIDSRFSLDLGIKKGIQNGKGELFVNATDLLNTMVIRKEINGNNFSLVSSDFYETQVIRLGYNYKF